MKMPAFWSKSEDRFNFLAAALSPLGALYRWETARRLKRNKGFRAPVPVICVGNITLGGTGKTPLVRAIAEELRGMGHVPHILSRGYGTRVTGPVLVDVEKHGASDVGDEPLLLARTADTWVSPDRAASARAACEAGADVLVMDDGLQNPGLTKDLSFLVLDGTVGFGNGRVFPAGPLRETLDDVLPRTDAAVIVGADTCGIAGRLPPGLPCFHGAVRPVSSAPVLIGARVFAFAGIGRPGKFFASLEQAGAEVVETLAFADHHRFGEGEIERVLETTARAGLIPITTEKDAVRLPAALREKVTVFPVRLNVEERDGLKRTLAMLWKDS